MSRKLHPPIPRTALTPAEAAASLGVGPDFFAEHVQPELRIVRRGKKRLIPVPELEHWLTENAEPVLAGREGEGGDPQLRSQGTGVPPDKGHPHAETAVSPGGDRG